MASKNDYASRLKMMVEYIEQDGHEKAEEIDVVAEEEYYMERRGYIDHRIGAVTKYYDNLENKYQQQMILDISRLKNDAYKSVLNARNSILDEVFQTVSDRMRQLTLDENVCLYKKVLYQLIVQGLVQMVEPEVSVRVRMRDAELAKKVLKQAQNYFARQTKMAVELSVDEENYLPDECNGGVVLMSGRGTMSVNNTLDARLEMAKASKIPFVRMKLFGPNPNRKHMD